MISNHIPQKILALFVLMGQGIVGCASMTQGTSQVITFDIAPPSSQCLVAGKGGINLGKVTPFENLLTVPKGKSDLTASCSAAHYQSNDFSIKSSAQPIAMASFLLDFGITDMLTGAMWAYPNKVEIVLNPNKSIIQEKQLLPP
jgi:hypothetical protein